MNGEGVSSKRTSSELQAGHPVSSAVRRDSCSSNGSSSLSCATPDYDSGHYSGASELVFQPGVSCSSEEEAQHGHEIRSMRSQLERLAKSERWYKNELKVQKRSKLDLLEKLYVNERKFMRENQKLQADCKRLYALCTEIERQKSEEKDELSKQLKSLEQIIDAAKDKSQLKLPALENLEFELQRQRATVEEHEHLIRTLRSQKQHLLEEMRELIQDRDAKLLEVEKKTIGLEFENRTITKRCLELVNSNYQLEEKLRYSLESSDEMAGLRQTSQKQHFEIGRLAAALNDHKTAAESEINHLQSQLETSNSKLKDCSQELSAIKAVCAEKQLQNDHLEAEIQQYKKMRENYDKYVTLLQGNSAELDSKCMEIEHLQSVIGIQSAQLTELNRSVEETKSHWKHVVNDLQKQLSTKDNELSAKQQHFSDLDKKRTAEIGKLRERLHQLESLNEKLLRQLRSSSIEITKKSSEIEELKAMIRGLEELNVENSQLKKLLEIKDEELNQRKVHDTFVCELQTEIQKLKNDLRQEMLKSKEMELIICQNKELDDMVRKKTLECETLSHKCLNAEKARSCMASEFQAQIGELKREEVILQSENRKHIKTIQSQSTIITQLIHENENLKAQQSSQNEIQAELETCRGLIQQYAAEKLQSINASHLENSLFLEPVATMTTPKQSQPKDAHDTIELLRETSLKVPETCDNSCQVNTFNVSDSTQYSDLMGAVDEVGELKLLQRVIDKEHLKRIGRYEVYISTLLGMLKSYRSRDAKEKSREVMMCEKKIRTLQEKLRYASRRSSELDHYKRQNLQLTSNLQSITDDYKKKLLSITSPPSLSKTIPKLNYDEYYQLIDKSNNCVPNFQQLIGSLDELKEDISQMKINTNPSCSSMPKVYLHPVKRLSLMDELKIVHDNFDF